VRIPIGPTVGFGFGRAFARAAARRAGFRVGPLGARLFAMGTHRISCWLGKLTGAAEKVMQVDFRLVDVFTDVPFAGNQLCVVPEPPAGLDERTMLTLTREIGFSETTFVTAVRPGGYDVRIFTPEKELPFAGHPTLGTAFTLAAEGKVGPCVVQRSAAGDVAVEVDLGSQRASMLQLPPSFGAEAADRASVACAAGLEEEDLVAGLPIQPVSTGLAHLMVPVRDEPTLRRAVQDAKRCWDVCVALGGESLYLFAVRGPGDVMARMFDRWIAIGEDPATGSAAGPLAAYLAVHRLAGLPGRAVIAQGELVGRPSFLHVEASREPDWRIQVGGGVRRVGEGRFLL
jgi:trans-2,3-dihydro-3-hydroxyanthranilate isomerase